MRPIDADAFMEFITDEAETETDVVIASVCRGAVLSMPTIDPLHAAGGCYCRECRFRGDPEECPLLHFNQRELDGHDTSDTDFCSYGEPREAREDG